MPSARLVLVAVCGLLTTACASSDPAALAKGTADFLIIAVSQDEYVEACTVRGFSSLECQDQYRDARAGHQAYYRAQEQSEREQAAESLSEELDEFLKSAEHEQAADRLPD